MVRSAPACCVTVMDQASSITSQPSPGVTVMSESEDIELGVSSICVLVRGMVNMICAYNMDKRNGIRDDAPQKCECDILLVGRSHYMENQ